MAYREVILTDEERAALSSTFVKFEAIGDKFGGVFLRTQPGTGEFNKGRPDYVFRRKNPTTQEIEDVTLSPNANLGPMLRKAALQPGYKVIITYTGDMDTGKASPLKMFRLMVDDAVNPAQPQQPQPQQPQRPAPAPAQQRSAAQPRPGAPAPADPFDDIPF